MIKSLDQKSISDWENVLDNNSEARIKLSSFNYIVSVKQIPQKNLSHIWGFEMIARYLIDNIFRFMLSIYLKTR